MDFKYLNEDGTDRRLSKTQQKYFDFIALFIEENNIPPTYREIMQKFNINAVSTIRNALLILKRRGFITWEPGQTRTIKILPTDIY